MNRALCLAAVLLVVTSITFAQAGKNVVSHDGSCQITVPSSWIVSGNFGNANSADKKLSATTSSPRMISSFDELKQNAQNVYANDKVTKNSASEFEMEGKSMNNKPNVYRGVPISGGKFCIVEVIYESGTAADARKIAETVKSAK